MTQLHEANRDVRREFGPIFDVGPKSKAAVMYAVSDCARYWPNAHLGSVSPREDIASAFRTLRRRVAAGESLFQAAGYLSRDALAHVDM